MDGFHNRFQFRNCLSRALTCLNCLLCCLDLFCTAYISRVFSGKCELCKSKRIGTVGGCLPDGISSSVVVTGSWISETTFRIRLLCKCSHLRPVLDVRAKLDLNTWICHALAVKYTVLVDGFIEEIFLFLYTSRNFSADVRNPLLAAVAAMERASISATEEIWPFWILEPSRFGKFLVVCRILNALLAGVSPAPKQGPQNAVFTTAPVPISSARTPFLSQLHVDRSTCRVNA